MAHILHFPDPTTDFSKENFRGGGQSFHFLKKGSLAALLMLICTWLNAQTETLVNKTWEYSFGVPNDYEWAASALDNNGNLITAGHTALDATNTELILNKQDADGNVLWQEEFKIGDDTKNGGVALAIDANNNIYVAGVTSTSGDTEDFDFLILKYDSTGTKLWHQTFDGPGSGMDVPTGIISDASKVYVCGASRGTGTGIDYWALKLAASDGSLTWQKRYDYAGLDDYPANMALDDSGNIVLTGSSAETLLNWEVATVKYAHSAGALIGEERVGNDSLGFAQPSAIVKDPDGNFIITGTTTSNGTHFDIRTIKLKDDLDLLWSEDYDSGSKMDSASAITCDQYGDVFVTGWQLNEQDGSEFLTLKYGSDGTLAWAKKRTVSPQSTVTKSRTIALDNDGGIIMAGGSGNTILVVKYNTNGYVVWEKQLRNPEVVFARPLQLLVNTDNEVFVTAISNKNPGNVYYTYKLNTLQRLSNPVLDSLGNPLYAEDEIIVRFKPGVIRNTFIDNKDLLFGKIEDIFADTIALQALQDLLPESDFEEWPAVKIFPNRTTADTLATTRLGKATHVPDFYHTLLVLASSDYKRIDDAKDIRDTLRDGNLSCFVKFVDINPIVTVDDCEPDDTNYANQGNLHPTMDYPNGHIDMEEAWCIAGASSSNIAVAITDTGIRWSHEDFLDENGNSVVIGGMDYANGTPILANNENDFGDHGTRVASVAGSVRNNATGIAGIAGGSGGGDGIRLIAQRCIDKKFPDPNNSAVFTASDVIQAYDDAISMYGVQVINTSGGFNAIDGATSILFREQVHLANRLGVIICASRGNVISGLPTDWDRIPGTIQDEWVLCIGGTGTDGNYNPECRIGKVIDVAAPSRWQLTRSAQNYIPNTTTPSDQAYGGISFTSGATPHATGLAAIMLNYSSTPLVQDDVEYIIQASATDVESTGYDALTGHRRISAGEALKMIEEPLCNVFHFGTDDDPDTRDSELIEEDISLELTEPYTTDAGLSFDMGAYTADVYKVTATVSHSLPSGFDVAHSWERHSASTVFDLYVPGAPNTLVPIEIVKFDGSPTQTTAVVEGYVYYLKNSDCSIEGWIPASPEDAELTYSLIGCSVNATDAPSAISFIVFPNPVSGQLTVNTPAILGAGFQSIAIHDFSGREVLYANGAKFPKHSTSIQLDVSDLPPGIYACVLTTSEKLLTTKFIKQ